MALVVLTIGGALYKWSSSSPPSPQEYYFLIGSEYSAGKTFMRPGRHNMYYPYDYSDKCGWPAADESTAISRFLMQYRGISLCGKMRPGPKDEQFAAQMVLFKDDVDEMFTEYYYNATQLLIIGVFYGIVIWIIYYVATAPFAG